MKRKNQEGAIVIEATIALTTFMFLIITILSIVNICLVQSRMGTLVHGIAKDVSNYSYIYTMTGLNEREQAISSKADYARNGLDEVKESSQDTFAAIEKVADLAMDGEFWQSMMSLFVEGGIQEAKGVVIDNVCKNIAEKRLQSNGKSVDAYLVQMGIEEGLEGLDFTNSSFCSGGGDDIDIVVTYTVKVLDLLGVDIEFTFEQCAATKTWCAMTGGSADGGSGDGGSGGSEDSEEAEESEDNNEDSENEDPENEDPEEEEEVEEKSLDDYVQDSTHNPSAPQVMIGEYTGNSETDYVELAKEYDMTYFDPSDEDKQALDASGDEWAVRKKFLEEQEFQGKQFVLSSDPHYASGMYANEVAWLESRGYTFRYNPVIGAWVAEK